MQNIKIKLFVLLLSFIAALTIATPYAIAADAYRTDYSNSGVEKSIKDYLCTPDNDTLFGCINKLYKFGIAVGAAVAVFFIVIAGYMYMSAEGGGEAVEKAKSIITTSITGLVLLIGGYVLLRALNPELVKFHDLQPPEVTTKIDQNAQQVAASCINGKCIYNSATQTGIGNTGTEDEVRQLLQSNGVSVNKPAPTTKLAGIRQSTIEQIITLKKNCNCSLTVTGGTESGHSEAGTCTHSNGYKFDAAMNSTLDNYIKTSFKQIATRSDNAKQWKDESGNVTYAEETTQGTGAHWDVAVCR